MINSLLLSLLLAAAPGAPGRVAPPPPVETVQGPRLERGPQPTGASDRAAVEAMAGWIDDPVQFVRENFGAEPDAWQADALRAVAREPRVAMSACKGPGKSCTLAWTIWWFLATRQDGQVICTSVTGPNLKDNLWKELSLWHSRSPVLQKAFEVKGERIVHRERPKTWWCSARTWAQDADANQQANSLAGFHGEHVLIVLDEVGDYPDGVVVAAEAIFANDVDAKLVVAGNPTRTDGPLYRIVGKDARRWYVIYITGDPNDPKRSPRISLEWAQQQIDDWGEDNDWVRINVLGLFPRGASDKLLGPNDVTLAEQRECSEHELQGEPIVFGLDVARFGPDRSVLYKRRGPELSRALVWRGLDGNELGDQVAAALMRQKEPVDYLCLDIGGVGVGVYNRLRALGWGDILIPVDFGSSPIDRRFADKRSEIWWTMAEWVKKRASLLRDGELASELVAPTFKYGVRGKRTTFFLESKDDLKKRGQPSPDKADAVALTFAAPLFPRQRGIAGGRAGLVSDFNPFDRSRRSS